MHTDERTVAGLRLLHGIFEQQARATPTAIALDVPPAREGEARRQLSYAEVNAAADAMANGLAAHIHGECVVAIGIVNRFVGRAPMG